MLSLEPEKVPPSSGKKAYLLTEMEYIPAPSEVAINDRKSRSLSSLLCSKVPTLSNSPITVSSVVTALMVTVFGFARENVKKSRAGLSPLNCY